jgi:hypothetical protein
MTLPTKSPEAAQAVAGALAAAVAPQLVGPEVVLWVLAALGICTLAETTTPAATSRWRLAARYLASVTVTLGASYTAAAAVGIYAPEWRGSLMAVQMGAVIVAGVLLHPLIAISPRLLAELWAAVLDRIRGSATQTKPSNDK